MFKINFNSKLFLCPFLVLYFCLYAWNIYYLQTYSARGNGNARNLGTEACNRMPSDDSPFTDEICYDYPLVLSGEGEKVSLKLLAAVHEVFVQEGIQYTICYGTGLSYFRSKYFSPWDDDMDMCLPPGGIDKVKSIPAALAERGILLGFAFGCNRVFFADRKYVPGHTTHSWPFIDLFERDAKDQNLFPPVLVNDFGGVTLYAPRDLLGHVKSAYGADVTTMCQWKAYCHPAEKSAKNVPHPGRKEKCTEVYDRCRAIYPKEFWMK